MSEVLASGLVELTPDAIDALPDAPAWYRLRSPGQRVMLVGHAGDEGLREAIRELYGSHLVGGLAFVEYEASADAAAAADAAARDIELLKPLYNDGFGRFRNEEVTLPRAGHCIRKAMPNP